MKPMKLSYVHFLYISLSLVLILNSLFLDASPFLRNFKYRNSKFPVKKIKVDQQQALMVPHSQNAALYQLTTKFEKASLRYRRIPCLGFKKSSRFFVLDSSSVFEEDIHYTNIMTSVEAERPYDIRLKTCKNEFLRVNAFSVPVPLRKGTIVSYNVTLVHSNQKLTQIPVPLSIRPGEIYKSSFYCTYNFCKEVST